MYRLSLDYIALTNEVKSGGIFPSTGGSMGPRYISQSLFFWNIAKLLITQQPLKLEKISTDLQYLELKEKVLALMNLKTSNFSE